MSNYSVRVGKQRQSTEIYVRTPKGAVLHCRAKMPSRESAKKLCGQIRSRLAQGGKLDARYWDVVRRAAA